MEQSIYSEIREFGPKRSRRRVKQTFVTVNEWCRDRGGAFQYACHSSNLRDPALDPNNWRKATIEGVRDRRRDGGAEKGRVVYLYRVDFFQGEELEAVFTYSIPKRGTVRLRKIGLSDTAQHRRWLLIMMCACAMKIAESMGTASPKVEVLVSKPAEYKRMGFVALTVEKGKDLLALYKAPPL